MYDHVGGGDPRVVPGAPNTSSSDHTTHTSSDGGGGGGASGSAGGGGGGGASQPTRYGGANPPSMGSMPPPDAYGPAAAMQATGSAWYAGDQRLPGIAHVAHNDLPRPLAHHMPIPGQPHGPIINIFDVNPQHGLEGTVISVSCDLVFPPTSTPDDVNKVRFVMGGQVLVTEVNAPIPPTDPYTIRVIVPSLSQLRATSTSVPISLEAVNEHHVLESVSLGDFHFVDGKLIFPSSIPRVRTHAQMVACLSALALAAVAHPRSSASTNRPVAKSPHPVQRRAVVPRVMVRLFASIFWWRHATASCVADTQQSRTRPLPLRPGRHRLLSTTRLLLRPSQALCARPRWLAAHLPTPTRTCSAPRRDSRSTAT